MKSAKSVRVKLYNGDEVAFIPDGIDGLLANKKIVEVESMIREAKGDYVRSELAGVSFSANYVASIHVAEPKYISYSEDTTNGWSNKGKFDILPGEILVMRNNGTSVYLGVPADIDYSDFKLLVWADGKINAPARPIIAKIKEKYPVIVSNLNKVLDLK